MDKDEDSSHNGYAKLPTPQPTSSSTKCSNQAWHFICTDTGRNFKLRNIFRTLNAEPRKLLTAYNTESHRVVT